jgi:diguanylate cyclase (GGDEF)-like protein/PAS domain S-box-containing protein
MWRIRRQGGARKAAMMDAALDCVITMDRHGRVLEWNPAAERTFGYSHDDAVGRELAELIVPPSLRDSHRAGLSRYLSSGSSSILGERLELTGMRSDGSELPVELTVTSVEEDGEEIFAGFVRDITDRKQMEDKLERMALHDPLTGLPNRTLFLDRLTQALHRSRRKGTQNALLFVDLDGFKGINDGLGHGAGDEVLSATAVRLVESVRPADTIARFGGDEFTVLCEDVPRREEAVAIARRLREAIEVPLEVFGDKLSLTASTGVVLSAFGRGSPESLLSEADSAMYRAKERGPGRIVVYDEEMRSHDDDGRMVEEELRRALERDEFRVVYQPQVDLATGAFVGAEALVRWDHPERGTVSPAEFIPLAEEAGMIGPIDELVLRRACQQAERTSRFRNGDGPFEMSVNCSASQLGEPDLAGTVADAVRSSGIDPQALCLEITESTVMRNTLATQGALRSLAGMGVKLAIDDFGTGYSSLIYLGRFPLNALKVDRTFVEGLGRRQDDSAIVAAVTDMAHALGMSVVAEGVEREDQVSELRGLGCDLAQGYYFARPETPEAFDRLLASAAAA